MAFHAKLRAAAIAPLAVALVGCVSRGRYDAALAREERATHDAATARAELDELRAHLDDEHAYNAVLVGRLEKLGMRLDDASGEKQVLKRAVREARETASQLRRAEQEAEARAAAYRTVADKLKSMIDAGSIAVAIRDDRMILQLPGDVLFDPGRADLSVMGASSILGVAEALRSLPDRHFQVAGHTDDVPITTARFPSNWELSAERAIQVVRFLSEHGVPASSLSAAGYAEMDPVAANDGPEGRRKNRRIEITIMPAIRESPRQLPLPPEK